MKLNRPDVAPLSKAELESLDTLKSLVEGAIADGVLTKAETENIRTLIWADGKVSPEELDIVQDLIWSKIQSGDLVIEWS